MIEAEIGNYRSKGVFKGDAQGLWIVLITERKVRDT